MYFVIPSTLNLGSPTHITGFAVETQSIYPSLISFSKIGLFQTQTYSLIPIEGM